MKRVLSLLSILALTSSSMSTLNACNNNNDKITFLDRDRTIIECSKDEKIGNINIRYTTNNDPNTIKNTILLWCTKEPNQWESGGDVYYAPSNLFYSKFKNKMDIKTFGNDEWQGHYPYSKEWDGKYSDNYFIN